MWHAGITVRDLDVSIAFYRDALGLELLRETKSSSVAESTWNLPGASARIAFLAVPGTAVCIELLEYRGVERHPASSRPCDFGNGHLCLYVDDLPALHGRLVAAGHSSRSGDTVTITTGPLAGSRVVYMLDPDGYHVELFEAVTG
jgi:catechol 2,3-dioxygenase-like lactoylglutathione lyase family enzyme